MVEIIWSFRGSIQHVAVLLLAGYAFWRGAGPEKATGAILLTMLAILWLFQALFPEGATYRQVYLGALAQDGFATAAFVVLALHANRIYPLWIAAAQVIALMMHLNREVSSMTEPLAYAIINRLPSYLQITAFALGLWAHRRRVRRFGTYRSWRTSSGRFWAKMRRRLQRR